MMPLWPSFTCLFLLPGFLALSKDGGLGGGVCSSVGRAIDWLACVEAASFPISAHARPDGAPL